MRFFTRAWCDGDVAEEEADRVPQLYAAHLRSIRSRLPFRVRRFIDDINLHDGRIREVQLSDADHTLLIRIRAGDQQVGYYDADLVYHDFEMESATSAVLDKARANDSYELLYDEFDTAEANRLVHRFILRPEGEALIAFRDLSWQRTPRKDRSSPSAV